MDSSSAPYDTEGDPTTAQYEAFERTCSHLNAQLFDEKLPKPILTFRRGIASASFFAPDSWSARGAGRVVSEIALNPDRLRDLRPRKIAAALVHELAHLWQHAFGRKSRDGYHNMEWSRKMESLGLMPSETGRRGGARVGQAMDQYVIAGRFQEVFEQMPREWLLPFLSGAPEEKKKDSSKSKFVCPCGDQLWGKQTLEIDCRKCREAGRTCTFALETTEKGDAGDYEAAH